MENSPARCQRALDESGAGARIEGMQFRSLAAAMLASQSLAAPAVLPAPSHVVMVIEENKSFGQVYGSPDAPYINALAAIGAVFTDSHGLGHPSQPNYLQLFSGSDQGVTDNTVPPAGFPFSAPNLGSLLLAAGETFVGYSEDLPAVGSTVGNTGPNGYWRKHNPWVEFSNVPADSNRPFGDFPDGLHYADLPTVSIVVPNQANDMHNGSVAAGDAWLQANLSPYVAWAQMHNSLFILTFDEDDGSTAGNDILTLLVGPMIRPGLYDQKIDHHSLLRTLEDMYGLGYAGNSANVAPLTLEAFQEVPEGSGKTAAVALAGAVLGHCLRHRRKS